ncbi:MAG: DUF2855 family protein [Oceanicoccus sp.]
MKLLQYAAGLAEKRKREVIEFQIRKDNLNAKRVTESVAVPLNEGQVRVNIEKFALTANNITYAVAGEQMGYWRFFPAINDPEGEWGVMPVWGFAVVSESTLPEIEVGERLYGYFPPATELTLTPKRLSKTRFTEGAPYRQDLAAAYNNYKRLGADPDYDASTDNERMLLAPLFTTSFCLWDSLADKNWCGAKQVIIVSASSKTSIGLSYALAADPQAPKVIGVTSQRNLALVEKIGTYDQGVTYDDVEAIDASIPSVIVDMSGNADVLGRLHSHLGDNMLFCSNVGITHWGEVSENSNIIKERSEFFFAPAHIQKRVGDWGAAAYEEKIENFMSSAAAKSREWMHIAEVDGLTGVDNIYLDVCDGKIAADQALIVKIAKP